MNDTTVSIHESASEAPRSGPSTASARWPDGASARWPDAARGRWLFLIHQIPSEPAYLRVKTLRRLNKLGAVALKSSVYVLPDTGPRREDFHWLRREIVDGGGEATLCVGTPIEGISDAELIELFRAASNEEYDDIVAAATAAAGGAEPSVAELRRLRQRLDKARERDHFDASHYVAAEQAMAALENTIRGRAPREETTVHEPPHGATWVTREGIHVDRMASGWLIRRFIDPAAAFKFVPPDGYEPLPGELRFDMFEGEFSHEGDRCTFETLIGRFGLDSPALATLAEIVHDVDCKDDKFGRREAEGIALLVAGISAAHESDEARMAAATSAFDWLMRRFESPAT